jgi:hypothetical protein
LRPLDPTRWRRSRTRNPGQIRDILIRKTQLDSPPGSRHNQTGSFNQPLNDAIKPLATFAGIPQIFRSTIGGGLRKRKVLVADGLIQDRGPFRYLGKIPLKASSDVPKPSAQRSHSQGPIIANMASVIAKSCRAKAKRSRL